MDPLLGAAIIAAVASLATTLIKERNQGKKIKEIHKQVSENSHANDKPTVLDLIADVREEQRLQRIAQNATHDLLVKHIVWHNGEKK